MTIEKKLAMVALGLATLSVAAAITACGRSQDEPATVRIIDLPPGQRIMAIERDSRTWDVGVQTRNAVDGEAPEHVRYTVYNNWYSKPQANLIYEFVEH